MVKTTRLTHNGHSARGSFDRLVGAGRAPRPDRRWPSSLGTLSPSPRSSEYVADVYRPQSSNLRGESMGLSWQQGPLSPGAIGRFLVPESLPKRLLYAEPLRRRMRVRFGGTWIADSENVFLLFEPGRYPVAYFPKTDISPNSLQDTEHTTRHPDLGLTSWYAVRAGEQSAPR